MGSICKQHGQPSTSWLCPSGSGCDLHSASRPTRASINSDNTCLRHPCRSETTVKLTLPTGHNPAGFPRLEWFCLEDDAIICGVHRKRSTTTGSGPWLAPNFLFQKPPSQGRPDKSTVWPKPAWNGSAWKTTTTDRNCRTHKACCTAVASLLQHQGAKAQSRGKLCSDPARVFTV